MKYFPLLFLVIAFPKSETSDECGIRIPDGVNFENPYGIDFRLPQDSITDTQFGEFPWVAAVAIRKDVDGNGELLNIYQCGGSLIHPQVVLTSASCVHDNREYLVRAGEWDVNIIDKILDPQDRDVTNVILHPDFSEENRANDIALLILSSPVTVEKNMNINTVCLPAANEVVDGAKCFDVGWGGTKVFVNKPNNYLASMSKFEVPIVPRDKCQAKFREAKHQGDFVLHESFMCAGGKAAKDMCTGGIGSSLVCPISGQSNKYYQAGIVSWGVSCDTPIAYTNVSLFVDWIKQEIANNNIIY